MKTIRTKVLERIFSKRKKRLSQNGVLHDGSSESLVRKYGGTILSGRRAR